MAYSDIRERPKKENCHSYTRTDLLKEKNKEKERE